MAAEAKSYTLREMVRQSGNTPRTIRFYEEIGLVQPIGRTPGGHRLYDARELEKLQLVSALRDAGLSLDEIKLLFALRRSHPDGRSASRQAISILTTKIDELKRRLSVLSQLKDELGSAVDIFRHSCTDCKHPPGQELCESCTDVDHSHLPRIFRWIWNVGNE
jgi:MerR family copper efflux transcriptional regulator